MDEFWQVLNAPDSFEKMALLIRDKSIIQRASQYLEAQSIQTSSKIFLSAWLIARFPESIEGTPDARLLASARDLVLCCTQNMSISLSLNIFDIHLKNWKTVDYETLSNELIGKYHDIRNIQATNNEAIKNMKKVLIEQAYKIGGKDLVFKLRQ